MAASDAENGTGGSATPKGGTARPGAQQGSGLPGPTAAGGGTPTGAAGAPRRAPARDVPDRFRKFLTAEPLVLRRAHPKKRALDQYWPLVAGTIGYDDTRATIVVDELPGVSGRHARLSWDPGADAFRLEDYRSRRGTFLKLSSHVCCRKSVPLSDGDIFWLGSSARLQIVRAEAAQGATHVESFVQPTRESRERGTSCMSRAAQAGACISHCRAAPGLTPIPPLPYTRLATPGSHFAYPPLAFAGATRCGPPRHAGHAAAHTHRRQPVVAGEPAAEPWVRRAVGGRGGGEVRDGEGTALQVVAGAQGALQGHGAWRGGGRAGGTHGGGGG